MTFELLVLFLCFLLYLYVLYYLTKDDFVIVRKDVSMEKIFNMAFLGSLVTLFFARMFYILLNPTPAYLSILGFLAIPYLPGLSLIGGIIGGSIFVYLYSEIKKLPGGKLFDLFALSFVSVMPFGFIGTFLITLGKTGKLFDLTFLFSLLIFFLLAKIIYPFSIRGEIKDGSLGLIFILVFSSVYFVLKLFLNINNFQFLSPENLVLFLTIIVSILVLLNREIMDKFLSK